MDGIREIDEAPDVKTWMEAFRRHRPNDKPILPDRFILKRKAGPIDIDIDEFLKQCEAIEIAKRINMRLV